MTIAHEFDYHKPQTISEALGLLGKYAGEARVLAGGTDLVCWLREDMVTPKALVDIKGLKDLERLELVGNDLHIGANVTFNTLLESDLTRAHAPLIAEMAREVASTGLRNRATLLGNICAAVPCCDSGPVLLALDARVRVEGSSGAREVPMTDWFKAPRKTACEATEIATAILIPKAPAKSGSVFLKLGRYRGEDLAQASLAVACLPDKTWRVAYGSVAPTPKRCASLEKLLDHATLDASLLKQAVALVKTEVKPITDVRATKEYRMHMCEVMLERGLQAALDRSHGKGPAFGAHLI